MNTITLLLYRFIILLIRIYKRIEYQLIRILLPSVKWACGPYLKKIGLEYDSNGDMWLEKRSGTESEKVKVGKLQGEKCFIHGMNLGKLGLGIAYIYKEWDIYDPQDLTEIIYRGLELNMLDLYYHPWNRFLEWLELEAFNLQSGDRTWQVGNTHYNLGIDLWEVMLGAPMQYNCGYWKNTNDFDKSIQDNMDLIARKLELKPGMRVLDIGCGWGSLAKYLAENYKVEVVGVTISTEGAMYARKLCAGLPVEIRIQDYSEVNEQFDRIVCVEMLMHVGYKNHKKFFGVANRCLKKEGLMVMQVIGRSHSKMLRSDSFIHKYNVFPNTNFASLQEVAEASEDWFVIQDWHNFGGDFAKTFYHWRANFIKGWPKLEDKFGGERFFRIWNFYLSSAQALFKARKLRLSQVVFSKNESRIDYHASR